MDLVLVAVVAIGVWMTIVAVAIAMCRAAACADAWEGAWEAGNAAVRPGSDSSALGRTSVPAV